MILLLPFVYISLISNGSSAITWESFKTYNRKVIILDVWMVKYLFLHSYFENSELLKHKTVLISGFFFLQSFEIFNTSDLQRLYLSLLTKKKVTQFSYLYLCCALVCLLDVLFHCQIVLQIYVYQTWQNLETCCVRWELTSLPG